MFDPSQMIRRSPDLVFAEIDDEAVAMSAAKGVCYGLDSIGLRVLQLTDNGGASLGAICAELVAEYAVDDQTCARDVSDLVADLEAEGLVRLERTV